MNQRIRELWDRAAESAAAYPSGDNNSWDTQVDFMDRFAKLIISECCVALHPMMRDMISRTQAVDMIVAHFEDEE